MAMKKQYIKPTIQVVKLQQQSIICTSPGSQEALEFPGGGEPIDDEKEVW